MNEAYLYSLKQHAFQHINIAPDRPDFKLMIGDAERLESVPLLLFTDFYTLDTTITARGWEETKWENAAPDLQNQKIMDEDHIHDFYIGETIA